MAKRIRKHAVGDEVVDVRHADHRRGRVVRVMTTGGLDGKPEALYRIDFGRYELHLSADEIAPAPER